MAEREGFEPPIPFRVCRFSRPVPSTTRPPLRLFRGYCSGARLFPKGSAKTPAVTSVSLHQPPRASVLRRQSERLGVKLHHFGEVRQEIGQAVVSRVRVIFVLHVFFHKLLV